jgi:hypothetical protein
LTGCPGRTDGCILNIHYLQINKSKMPNKSVESTPPPFAILLSSGSLFILLSSIILFAKRGRSPLHYRNSKILIKYCIFLFLFISEISVLTTSPSQGKYSNFLSGVFAFPDLLITARTVLFFRRLI